MKKHKSTIIVIISIILLAIIGIVLYILLNNSNKLTVMERNWINNNVNTLQNINIVNDANVFGNSGSGVFYDFLNDFSKEYSLTINPITFNTLDISSGISLGVKKSIEDNDLVFYTDHYVLVGKNSENINNLNIMVGKPIGILNSDLSIVSKYMNNTNLTITQFENKEALYNALANEEISYFIVPRILYLNDIISNNYHIIYHFSDAKIYFTMQSNDSTLSSVLNKYYQKWQDNFSKYYYSSLFKVFTSSLNMSDTEIDALQSVEYNYGFVNTSPYEVIIGGKYGGIVAVYLADFSSFAGVDFNFIKYNNFKKFTNAIGSGDIDLYFNYYNFTDNYNATSGIPVSYVVVARRSNDIVVKSINSLIGETVYVEENSKIFDYVSSISGINIKTYSNINELFKLNKKDVYIILDKNTFNYYSSNKLNNYTERHSDLINSEYTFKVKTSSGLYRLLDKYIEFSDSDETILRGLENHYETMKSGSLITNIAKYILYAVIIILVIVLIILKRSKKIIIARKIKRDDKIKFIDQLTSIKNRNYLTENISNWNNNTIYPQTIIVIDLNKVQEINDVKGYEEGDKQIKALANILVKTQLDNSEVMRTDGNEFVIYLVGYNQKQITNYIHKLSKEIKKLPYDFGAEFGYSMILDDIKTIEDALNEAVEDMKRQKEKNSNER